MKKLLTLLLLNLIVCKFSFSQNWQWAKGSGGQNLDGISYCVRDIHDNIYVSGSTSSYTYYWGNDSITIPNNGRSFVIAKYSSGGNEIWTKIIRVTGLGGGKVIYDSSSDATVVVGNFTDSISCDTFSLTNPGESVFVAKFDNNGNCLWLKFILSAYRAYCSAAEVDQSGNIYIAPSSSTPYYGPVDTVLAGGNIIKLDSNGNILWIKNKINNYNWYTGSCVDLYAMRINNNKIFISGTGATACVIDTITFSDTTQYGLTLICCDMNANVLWAKVYSSAGTAGLNMDIDLNGNIYTIGDLDGTAHFANDSLTNSTYPNGFIAKFDSTGKYIWAKNFPTTSGSNIVANCNTSLDGKTYITGFFNGVSNFGNYSANASDTNMFIARYDSTGNCLGVKNFGKAHGNGITTLSNGNPVVSGSFTGNVNIGSTSLSSRGDYDSYVAKLDVFTGVENNERLANNQLLIYANPNNGKCNITIPDEFLHEKNLTLSIYDNTGKLIQMKTLEMNEEKIKINLDSEAKGMYVVTLSNGVKNYNGKIIFE